MFFIDIILSFHSSYLDEMNFHVTDKKTIAHNYLTTWFWIDFLAIIPIDLLFRNVDDLNEIVRVIRIGKLYKLIKLTKLLRLLKMAHNRT